MLIVLAPAFTEEQRRRVLDAVRGAGLEVRETRAGPRALLVVEGESERLSEVPFQVFPGVERVVALTPPYTLASLEHQPDPTVVRVGRVAIGGGGFVICGGPCAVEDLETLRRTARAVKDAGADLLRG